MFFISWGSKRVLRKLGPAGVGHCDICNQERNFFYIVSYSVSHVLWIFRWVTGRSYQKLCEICGRGEYVSPKVYEADPKARRIPWIDRRGWMAGLGLLAVLIAGGAVLVRVDEEQTRAYVAQPQPNDIYTVNAARLLTHPPSPDMYATLRVTRVSPQDLEMVASKSYYNRLAGVSNAISNGEARSDDYYFDEPRVYSRATIEGWRRDGILIQVDR